MPSKAATFPVEVGLQIFQQAARSTIQSVYMSVKHGIS
jgi:hypothetical protein